MSRLLDDALRTALPKLREQQDSNDPMVYAVFYFPLSGWKWFVTEGEPDGDDFPVLWIRERVRGGARLFHIERTGGCKYLRLNYRAR